MKKNENEDEPIAGSSRTTEGDGTDPVETQVNRTAEALVQAAVLSPGFTEAQCSEVLAQAERSILTFNNIDIELAYYEALAAHHRTEHQLVELRQNVLGKAMHSCDESLDALTEPQPTQRSVVAIKLMGRVTVRPPAYSSHNDEELAELIRKTINLFEADEVLYPTDRDWMLFAEKYLVGNAATRWWHYREKYSEALNSHMKSLFTDLTAPPQQWSDHVF